jgi:predicted unusual protein kinase regulating ubiquinone biosynthesis (AarF/ABC1/UbiB family)
MLPARLTRHFPDFMIDELREQLVAEMDYALEAKNIAVFSKALKALPFIGVPKVYSKLSGTGVLTMSLLEGMHLDAFLATKPSQSLRDLVGARLFELFYFQVLRLGRIHADPHWGNYLFREDGSIALLDFGCVKVLSTQFVDNLRKVFLYPADRDSDAFVDLMNERYALNGMKLSKAARAALVSFSVNFYGRVYPPEPELENVAFDFSDTHFLTDYMREASALMRHKGTLPEYIWLGRAELGLYQTLMRLRARVTTSRIVRRYL